MLHCYKFCDCGCCGLFFGFPVQVWPFRLCLDVRNYFAYLFIVLCSDSIQWTDSVHFCIAVFVNLLYAYYCNRKKAQTVSEDVRRSHCSEFLGLNDKNVLSRWEHWLVDSALLFIYMITLRLIHKHKWCLIQLQDIFFSFKETCFERLCCVSIISLPASCLVICLINLVNYN